MAEFLVEIDIELPLHQDADARAQLLAAEAARARELVSHGSLVRIWRLPGRSANVGVWRAADATELHQLLTSLPLHPFMDVRVTALARHPVEADLARDDGGHLGEEGEHVLAEGR